MSQSKRAGGPNERKKRRVQQTAQMTLRCQDTNKKKTMTLDEREKCIERQYPSLHVHL